MKPFPHDPLIPRKWVEIPPPGWRDVPIDVSHLFAALAVALTLTFAGVMFALGWIVGYLR